MKIENILKQYEESKQNDEIIEVRENCYEYRNEKIRRKLRNEYINLLSEDKKLAIELHKNLCHSNHIDCCSWHYEINGLEHDWNGYEHKKWLDKAKEILKVSDFNTACAIIEIF